MSCSRTVALLVWIILLGSCGNEPTKITFVPDPQVLDTQAVVSLDINASAPDFNLPAADGKRYGLSDFGGKEVLIVAFLSNHCAQSQVYEQRLKKFVEDYKDEVAMVAISPNSPLAVPEDKLGYSDLDDSYASMVERKIEQDFNFPYLYDGDDQQVSLRYGPSTLPSVFIFDQERKLRYRGRLDVAPWRFGGNLEDLRLVVNAVLEKREIIRPIRDSYGCKVYWSWDQSDNDELKKAWRGAPVTLRKIDLDSLRTILVNFSSNIRVVNFWATWCGPCKKEFPEFSRLKRMYRHRPVEFFTVSLDELKNSQTALDFLQQIHAPGKNFILTETDKELIKKSVYSEWSGTLPFTMVIEPLGEIHQVYEGPFNPLALRRTLVDHRLMGRFLKQ